jgi:hypothetical protein
MIKKVTTKWLESHGACDEAIERFKNQKERDPIKLLELMIRSNHKEILDWANWLIVRIMNKKQRVEYARYAILSAIRSAEYAAWSAWYAAWSAEYAAWSAEYAARSTARSAMSAEYKNTLIKILKHGIEALRKK